MWFLVGLLFHVCPEAIFKSGDLGGRISLHQLHGPADPGFLVRGRRESVGGRFEGPPSENFEVSDALRKF